ncbi:hypothetical protein MASR2M48_34340 [Spirochaetota bacterium]
MADLAALYVKHSRPVDLPAAERYVPSKTYTGIVVFIKEEYGVRENTAVPPSPHVSSPGSMTITCSPSLNATY